jgi:hypothetical protein
MGAINGWIREYCTWPRHRSRRSFVTSVALVTMHQSCRALALALLAGGMGGSDPSQPHTLSGHVLSSTCPPFAFGPIYSPVPVRIPESYSRCSVGTPWPLQPHNEITESSFGSLSGPRVLITPISALSQVTRLALPPFRYVIRHNSWIIKNGNRGRDMQPV